MKIWSCFLVLSLTLVGGSCFAQSQAELLKSLKAVDHKAEGNEAAQEAYNKLIESPKSELPAILKAFDGANPLAENYLQSAFQVIADTGKGGVPKAKLIAFLKQTDESPRARALAFEWLKEQDAKLAEKMLEEMLLDPSAPIRRQAVQLQIDKAKQADAEQAKAIARQALQGATDEDQVKEIRRMLEKAGEKVDLVSHFGLLTNWKIIGPFDNKDMHAFDVIYPPEKEIDFSAKYEGMKGEVAWQPITTEDAFGKVDIAASIAPHKGCVMYLYTEYHSEKEQDVWFRLATPNAWKLWVDDKLVFAREEYHRGMRWDQYRVPAHLTQGKNVLLFKILQNEQEQDWAQTYAVQFRVCNKEGIAILPTEPFQVNRQIPASNVAGR